MYGTFVVVVVRKVLVVVGAGVVVLVGPGVVVLVSTVVVLVGPGVVVVDGPGVVVVDGPGVVVVDGPSVVVLVGPAVVDVVEHLGVPLAILHSIWQRSATTQEQSSMRSPYTSLVLPGSQPGNSVSCKPQFCSTVRRSAGLTTLPASILL